MKSEEALAMHAAVRYNLPNHKMKEAVDIAFEALEQKIAISRADLGEIDVDAANRMMDYIDGAYSVFCDT